MTSGIPQGAVIGLLLFSLFISNTPDLLENYISILDDDTKIYRAILNGHEAQQINLQED